MLGADAYVKAVGALVSAVFALLVLLAGRRRTPNHFLGAFLLLIAGNLAAETLRSLAQGSDELVLRFRVATVFAALDPLFLYYFASLWPTRGALNRTSRVGLVLASSAAFAAGAPFVVPFEYGAPASKAYHTALAVWTMVVYSVVLRHVYHEARADPRPPVLLTFVALCLVTMPAWARPAGGLVALAQALVGAPVPRGLGVLTAVALTVGGLAVVLWGRRSDAPPAARGAVRGGVAAGLALVAAFLVVDVASLLTPNPSVEALLRSIGRAAVPVRWLAFGVLVSIAVIRHDFLQMPLRWRRRAARVMLGLLFLVAATILLQASQGIFGWPAPGQTGPELVLLAAAVALSQGFRSVVDRAAEAFYGVPRPTDPVAAHAVYRHAVLAAATTGRSPATDPDLLRLKDELGLDRVTAGLIERTAEADQMAPLEEGHLVGGRYRVLGPLGRGGQGRAWLARDAVVAREVVLKEIVSDAAAVAEARAAGGLHHPNVIVIHDVIQRRSATFVVMQYHARGSLAERLEARPLDADEAIRILRGILLGVSAVHARGLVHGDIKPQNVMLAEDGRAVVADFGTARASDETTVDGSRAGGFMGTPAYMAPEQRHGGRTTPATDVYAIGRLAHRLLDPAPEVLADVLARAVEEDPERRWRDAGELLGALDEALLRAGPVHEQ